MRINCLQWLSSFFYLQALIKRSENYGRQHKQYCRVLKLLPTQLSLPLIAISFFTFYFLLFSYSVSAQGNTAARYEIDAKRTGVNPISKEAMPSSREFIRLDSTYYVGYMFEGLYKADKSSDKFGFSNAIPALRTAFVLLERDYSKALKSIYTAPETYLQNINRYIDYLQIASNLRDCYDNLEMADSTMWILNKVDDYHFPKEHFPVTTLKAWTYHRNRFFTSAKFNFLANTVAENEHEAFAFCFQALNKINRNEARNNLWFGQGQAESDRQSVYHYLALLHSYNKTYDSSEYYYQKMIEGGTISWNNYANLKHELGDFAVANEYFNRDRYKYGQKTLKEPYYYLPTLDVYAGRTKQAINTSQEAINFSGSSPGFGWYTIALSRAYLYDGQLDSAQYALDKAAGFKEIHIGTTLTQSQYDFTVNLLKLQLAERKIGLAKFTNRGWWYSPTCLWTIAGLKIEKILLEYVLINQLSVNPERERIVYDLFCGESTTTFDEAMYLIKDFSPAYFIKKYEQYQQTDPRKNIDRYFALFTHQMQWINGNSDSAMQGYLGQVQQTQPDTTTEKLYLARLYEGLSRGYEDKKKEKGYAFYTNALYEQYPQILLFNNLPASMILTTTGENDAVIQKVVKGIKECNIHFTTTASKYTPKATIQFVKKGDSYEASISVMSGQNLLVVDGEKMIFKSADGVGKELAQRLFGKGGALVFERALKG